MVNYLRISTYSFTALDVQLMCSSIPPCWWSCYVANYHKLGTFHQTYWAAWGDRKGWIFLAFSGIFGHFLGGRFGGVGSRSRNLKMVKFNGGVFVFFLVYVCFSTLLLLPTLRLHFAGGCWDRTLHYVFLLWKKYEIWIVSVEGNKDFEFWFDFWFEWTQDCWNLVGTLTLTDIRSNCSAISHPCSRVNWERIFLFLLREGSKN